MKFNAETQRLEHPQARLIPQPLWDALFKNELTDAEIMLLQADITQDQERIAEALQDLNPIYTFSGEQKLRAGVCILLGHPEQSDALIQNAEVCMLSPEDLLNIAVITNRNDLISPIVTKYPSAKNWLNSAFVNACRVGNIEALERFAAYSPENVYAMIEYKDYRSLVNAAKNNQLLVMAWLMSKLSHDERQEMLLNSHAFSAVARSGHLSAMEWLLSQLDDNRARSTMIKGAFNDAAENGHLHIMEWIMQQSSQDERHAMLTQEQRPAFDDAAKNGHLHIMSWLFDQLNPDEQYALITSNEFDHAFKYAAENGHLHILDWMMTRLSLNKKEKERFRYTLRDVFEQAAENGHLDIIKWALRQLDDAKEEQELIDSSRPFIRAAQNGHVHVLEWYAQQTRNKKSKVIEDPDLSSASSQASKNAQLASMELLLGYLDSSNKDEVITATFQSASGKGHLSIMQWLIGQLDEKVNKSTLLAQAFESSAWQGHLPVMQWLVEQADFDTRLKMIRKDNYAVFRNAAKQGQLSTLKWLMKQLDDPTEQQAMLKANDYEAFREAGYGQLTVLKWLVQQLSDPNEQQVMLKARHYEACKHASWGGGYHDIVEWFMDNLPDNGQAMIKENDYEIFKGAVRDGHLSIMKLLLKHTDEISQKRLVIDAYKTATTKRKNNKAETDYLLSFPSLVTHIEENIQSYEAHTQEYGGRYIPLFVNKQLQSLRSQKNFLETNNAHAVFDIDANQARICFYMLRNLIRRNSDELRDDILFLLNIPAVKALVHTEVTRGRSNELLRLALLTENRGAADILLAIPAVRELAAAHNYYRDEMRGQLDLRALARDRESSMRSLSKIEQKRLDKALERYQPVMTEQGVEPLFQKLQADLVARYAKHPATVTTGDGRTIDLPLQWHDWEDLAKTLSAETRERALLAYYQHKDHTALRYLSRPNPWMFEHAEYVNHDSNGMWSTFDQYKAEIVMFWLAAGDQGIAPIDGFTFETRMDHFVDELALLGRAHNWDQSRVKINAEGEPVLDDEGNVITEEYDDLHGDKPSCYSGVKRRLLQSVLGHPLLKLLTMDAIKQELREFAREHFKQVITDKNCDEIREAWSTLCMGNVLNEAQQESLAKLNIPQEKQTNFIEHLAQKYPGQFDDNDAREFRCYVEDSFKPTKIFEWHAVRFAAETDLEKLLVERLSPASIRKAKSKLSQCGDAGKVIIDEIKCLQRGSKSSWSVLWACAEEKLAGIIAVLNALPDEKYDANFIRILEDENSALFRALFKPLSTNSEPADVKLLDEIKACVARFGSSAQL